MRRMSANHAPDRPWLEFAALLAGYLFHVIGAGAGGVLYLANEHHVPPAEPPLTLRQALVLSFVLGAVASIPAMWVGHRLAVRLRFRTPWLHAAGMEAASPPGAPVTVAVTVKARPRPTSLGPSSRMGMV